MYVFPSWNSIKSHRKERRKKRNNSDAWAIFHRNLFLSLSLYVAYRWDLIRLEPFIYYSYAHTDKHNNIQDEQLSRSTSNNCIHHIIDRLIRNLEYNYLCWAHTDNKTNSRLDETLNGIDHFNWQTISKDNKSRASERHLILPIFKQSFSFEELWNECIRAIERYGIKSVDSIEMKRFFAKRGSNWFACI